MSDPQIEAFLAGVPLFEGHAAEDVAAVARVVRRREVKAGETLWRQGEAARDLLFVYDGRVAAALDVPGDRPVGIWSAGRGEVVGEIALLDGDGHTMGVEALEDTVLLALGRAEFGALLARQDASALRLRRRLALTFVERLRGQLSLLADSLGADAPAGDAAEAARVFAGLEPAKAPDPRYVRRMATFHDVDPLALWGFLTSGTYATCPAGHVLLAEGADAPACFLTMNGAVEKVLLRGDQRIRVGLAGPGRLFGYESPIDGRPSPLGAITRERALLLVVPRGLFRTLFDGEDAVSRMFLDVMVRELAQSLRMSLRGHARLAASV
jgi:CRP-like cAMP-binding protein